MKLNPRRDWKFVALYTSYVLALHAIDGPWKHWKEGYEGRAFDPWSFQHVIWGLIAQRMGLERNQIMALSAINEAVEMGVRAVRPDLLWGSPETPLNVITDLGATWAGWEMGRFLPGGRP